MEERSKEKEQKVVVIEKRGCLLPNNVLHLWPFYHINSTLRASGQKKFYGKFCVGSLLNYISIRQFQLILLKVSLILGGSIHVNGVPRSCSILLEDQENESVELGTDSCLGEAEGCCADKWKGPFIRNCSTPKVEERSVVWPSYSTRSSSRIYLEATGIDLENIVHYKDDTHYFVMTAKAEPADKMSTTCEIMQTQNFFAVSRECVDQELLNHGQGSSRFLNQSAAAISEFAINHYGTARSHGAHCMAALENAAMVRSEQSPATCGASWGHTAY
uniref:Uncharacterized protein n=1 Tax=Sphaerodactylus townsendi TaxID=933632 RepID=A0ACB8FMF4_9SAUR